MTRTTRKPATSRTPCEVCGAKDGCSRSEDGFFLCRKQSGNVPGLVYLGQSKKNTQWGQYRRVGDPLLNGHAKAPACADAKPWYVLTVPKKKTFRELAVEFSKKFTSPLRSELAELLGLPEASFSSFPLIGFDPDNREFNSETKTWDAMPCWTFPEVDAAGTIIGIIKRFRDGKKKAVADSNRGLYVPDGWSGADGPVFCPEGASDTLAMGAAGLCAVGRPSNTGGVELLVGLLKAVAPDRPIVVVGEYDPKPDGAWPGRDGAVEVSTKLAELLPDRKVQWTLPPDGAKDFRKWATSRMPDGDVTDAWQELGQVFLAGCEFQQVKPTKPPGELAVAYIPRFIDSATFAATDYSLRWLIRRLLVLNQPAFLGGPKKTLKTSFLVDLAISLGTGNSFLGEFAVEERRRTVLISGESGPHTIKETAKRVCAAKGVEFNDAGVLWDFELPCLSKSADMDALYKALVADAVQVVIIDPLYLALLAGGSSELRTENQFQMGPLLLSISRTCLRAGATPIIAAHTKKNIKPGDDPIDLDDLAYSGLAEFARQWLLVSRQKAFEPGTGRHKLLLSAGGSVGHGGLWSIDVEEGQLDDNFEGRKWAVKIATAAAARKNQQEMREQQKERQEKERADRDDNRVLDAIDKIIGNGKPVASRNEVKALAGLSGDRMTQSAQRLLNAKRVQEVDARVPSGKGWKVAPGLVRSPSGTAQPTPSTDVLPF
jgi:hypothetical protein